MLSGNSLYCIADTLAVNCRHYFIKAMGEGWLISTRRKIKNATQLFLTFWLFCHLDVVFLLLTASTDCLFVFLFAGPPLQDQVTS